MADVTNLGLGGVQNPFLGTDNPYLTGAIDAASQDMVRNYNLTTQPAFNAGMVRSGSFGNSAIDELNRNAQSQLQSNLGDLASKFRYNDYNNQGQMWQNQQNFNEGQRQFDLGFGRNVYNDAYSQNMNNLQTGISLLGTLGGYNATDINNATTQQNAPMNYWQQFANGANAIGSGGGSSVGTQGTTSNPFMSAAGGAQLGNAAMNWWNQNNGGGGITGTNGGNAGPYSSGQTLNNNFGGGTNYFGAGFP